MAEQISQNWEWLILTVYYGNDGILHLADPKYYLWPIKSALALFREEGWELVRVVPIKAKPSVEIKHDKYKTVIDFLSSVFKKPRNLVDNPETAGEANYYFKRPKPK